MSDFYKARYDERQPLPPLDYGEPEIIDGELNYQEKFDSLIDRVGEKSAMAFKNFTLYAGNSKTYVTYVKDRWLNPIDVQNAIGTMTVKVNKDDVTPLIQKHTNVSGEGAIGTHEAGEMYFYFVQADTISLSPRQYVFDVKVQLNGKTYTVAEGVINILQAVNP